MNVALLIDSLDLGGAQSVVRQLALGLARRGHGAFVYCLKWAGPARTELDHAGITVRQAHSTGRDPLLAWRLLRWLHQDRIDVANAHASAALVWALPAAKALGIPVIQTRHGALLGQMSRYGRWADRLVRLVDRVAIVAEPLRREIPVARVAREAVYLPNGIDRERVSPGEARGELERLCGRRFAGPIVLSVGTVCVEKDTGGLLRALAILRRDWPEARLVCAGAVRGKAFADEVKRVERELRLVGCVDWLGPVHDAYRLMAGADVFCLPSRTEAMPIAVVEAMSQGVPIVATAVGVVGRFGANHQPGQHLLRHNETGLLVRPGRPRALAAALGLALADREAARARADRALEEYRRSHTAAEMVRCYLDTYAGLVRRRRPLPCRRAGRVTARPRPGVLMVGPGDGQIGGMVSVIDALMDSSMRESFRLHRFAPAEGSQTQAASRRPDRLSRLRRTAGALRRHAGALLRMLRIIQRERISIVHIHTCSFFSFHRNLVDLAVARLLGARVCLHIHGARFAEFCAGSNRLGRWLIRRGCEAADATIVLSRRWLDTLRPYLGNARLVAISNGVEPVPNAPTRRSRGHRRCRFLFLGALTERKGLAELIDAAAALQRRAVAFELIIAGPATRSELRRWQRQVGTQGLEKVVQFTGPVQGEAKADLLASADCFVLPSYSEGLPIAILEAAAVELPVIATTVGSVPEFMTTDGDAFAVEAPRFISPLVPPGDVDKLAREMSKLAGDPQLRRAIGARLRAHVTANYTVEHQALRITRLYADIPAHRLGRPCGAADTDLAERSAPASCPSRHGGESVASSPPPVAELVPACTES